MKALRFHGRGDLRLDDIAEPTTTPGTVKVQVQWCGICGSDIHEFLRGPRVLPTPDRPHPLTGEAVPLILGHELAGVVTEVGAGVDERRLAPGTAVAVEPLLTCGRCPPCRRGDGYLCEIGGAIGLSGGGGGMSELVVVDESRAHRLGAGTGTDVAALAEPLAVGWHAIRRGGVGPGKTALVIGAGPVGLACLVGARAAAAERVVVSVRRRGIRAELAEALGADAVVRDAATALAQGGSGGFDVVLDTAATPESLRTALAAVRRGGVVVDVGLWMERADVNLNKILAREISLVGSMAYSGEFAEVVAALADGGLGDVGRMITRRVSLDEAIVAGFGALVADKGQHVKILVHP